MKYAPKHTPHHVPSLQSFYHASNISLADNLHNIIHDWEKNEYIYKDQEQDPSIGNNQLNTTNILDEWATS